MKSASPKFGTGNPKSAWDIEEKRTFEGATDEEGKFIAKIDLSDEIDELRQSHAQTPASVVYDYYNPEAQAIVAPARFSVK